MKKQYALLLALFLTGCAGGGPKDSSNELTPQVSQSEMKKYFSGLRLAASAPGETQGRCSDSSTSKSTDWKALVQAASQCVVEKNWKKVEELAFEISRRDLNNPWAPYFISLTAEQSGEFARAMWMVELAMKKSSPDIALFRFQKGRLWFAQKQVSKAMSEFEFAAAKDPHLVEANVFLGEVHFRDSEPDKAMAYFKKVVSQDETNIRGLKGLAECHIQFNKGEPAAELLAKAATVAPSDLNVRLRLAYVWEELLKNQTQALTVYQGLKASLSRGTIREKPDFDLNAKIKSLEGAVQAENSKTATTREISSERKAQ